MIKIMSSGDVGFRSDVAVCVCSVSVCRHICCDECGGMTVLCDAGVGELSCE